MCQEVDDVRRRARAAEQRLATGRTRPSASSSRPRVRVHVRFQPAGGVPHPQQVGQDVARGVCGQGRQLAARAWTRWPTRLAAVALRYVELQPSQVH